MNKIQLLIAAALVLSASAAAQQIDNLNVEPENPSAGEKVDITAEASHRTDGLMMLQIDAGNGFSENTEYCGGSATCEYTLKDVSAPSDSPWELRARAQDQNGDYSEILNKDVTVESKDPEPETHRLTVNVMDEDGNRLEYVKLDTNGETERTNSFGRARFDLEDGDYTVEASKLGYNSESKDIEIDGSDKSVDITLDTEEEEEHELAVDVEDEEGEELEDATVKADGDEKSTNSAGRTRFDLKNGDYEIEASKQGYNSESKDIEVDGSDETITIQLSKEEEEKHRLTVNVKDQDGDRIENANVEVDGDQKSTNSYGRVRVDLKDDRYRVEASKSGYDSDSDYVRIDGSDESVTLKLDRKEDEEEYRLTVNVKDDDGDRLEDATVEIDGDEKTTNSYGRARFDLEDGDYEVEASKEGYSTNSKDIEIDGSDKSINLELNEKDDDEKHRLTVNVKDGSGERLENAEVEVDGDEKTTNSYGRARFDLEDDYYTVEASKSGYDSDSEGVRVDGSDESVTLYLDERDDFKEYDLDVNVEDQYSNKVENAVVTADGFSDRTDSDGEAYFNNLREGDYRVVASKDGYLPESREINLDRDREITMVLRKSSSEVKAEYDYIPSRPEAGETVEFDASRSGGDIVDYRWSFGDGSSGNGREVEHSYESGGWYSARLTVENSEGDTDSTTRSIYVEEEEQEPGELDVEVEDEENDPLEDARVTAMALSPYNYAVRSSDIDTDSERTSSSKVGDYKLGFELDEDELQTNAEYSSGYDRASWSGTVLESSDSDRIVVRYDLSADSREGTYRKYEASQDIDLSSGEKEVTMILTVNGDVLEEYTSVIDVPDEHSFEAENKGTGTEYTGRDTRVSTASAPFFSEYTDSNGHAFFEVPDGRYLVTASKPGYTTDRTTINVDEGERREIGLELEDLRDDREDDDDDQDDSDEEQVVMQEVRIPSSVCEGDSLTARIEVENTGDDDLDYTLSATGLGTETDRVYYLDEGESDTKTVTFSNVQGSGNQRVSFSTSYDSEERTVQVRDCETEESGLSASVTPKQVRIGDSIRVSGIAEGVGSQNIDISIGGRSATSMSTEPDGRFSTYIIPNRVGTHQVEVESRDRSSTASVQVLPTVAVNSVGVPNNVFEGEDFEVCGDVESQTAPLVLLKKDGQIIDSKNGRGEICFELNEKPGTYSYEIQALNRGASNTASRTVEVMEQGSEATNFPDQIASVESGSGMVKVELYNNRKELRNYEIELEGLPRTWTAQSRKEVSLNSGERSTEYIYFTPKQEGDYEASLKVRSHDEEIHSETIDISSGGTSETESFWGRFRALVGLN